MGRDRYTPVYVTGAFSGLQKYNEFPASSSSSFKIHRTRIRRCVDCITYERKCYKLATILPPICVCWLLLGDNENSLLNQGCALGDVFSRQMFMIDKETYCFIIIITRCRQILGRYITWFVGIRYMFMQVDRQVGGYMAYL